MAGSLFHESRVITKRLEELNLKRCLTTSVCTLFLILALSIMAFATGYKELITGARLKYILFLVLFSFAYIFTQFFATKYNKKKLIKPLYLSYYFMYAFCLAALSHVYYIMSKDISFYTFFLLFVDLVPVLSRKEQLLTLLFITASDFVYLYVHNITGIARIHIVLLTVVMAVVETFVNVSAIKAARSDTALKSERHKAQLDPLTGLLNRRGLESVVESAWTICSRNRIATSVIMLDIDFFKAYNDTFGHPAGDRCIKEVAKVINATAKRNTDYNSRIGGEEFLIFTQGMRNEDLLMLAKRIQRNIEELAMPHACHDVSDYVTVSIGISRFVPDTHRTFKELYQKADHELYNAKQNGRNCISINGSIFSRPTTQKTFESYSSAYGNARNSSYYIKVAK